MQKFDHADRKLEEVPEGQWNCPTCLANAGVLPTEPRRSDSSSSEILDAMDRIINGVTLAAIDQRNMVDSLDEADRRAVEVCLQQAVAAVQRASWRAALRVGSPVDALDCNRYWYRALVAARRAGTPHGINSTGSGQHTIPGIVAADPISPSDGTALLIHFCGWSSGWDEWIPALSERIQPANTQDLTAARMAALRKPRSQDSGSRAVARLEKLLADQRGQPGAPPAAATAIAFEAERLAETDWQLARHGQ